MNDQEMSVQELIHEMGVKARAAAGAMRGGVGALLGFLAGVVLKFAACALFTWWFVQACWG